MRKFIIILTAFISLNCYSQSKDTTAKDTVFVLSPADMNLVIGIIRSNSIQVQGKQLSFDELLQIVNYLYGKAQLVPKKSQPKK